MEVGFILEEISIQKNQVDMKNRDRVAAELISILKNIMRTDDVNLDDSFVGLGGNSLKAIELEWLISCHFQVDIAIEQVFSSVTISDLLEILFSAIGIEKNSRPTYLPLCPVELQEYYETSAAQKRMYILNQFSKDSIEYNMPCIYIIEGDLDKVRLEDAFIQMIEMHEAFRTFFEIIDDEVFQKISTSIDFEIEYIENEEKDIETIIKGLIKPFNLGLAPLLRVNLVRIGTYKHMLIIDVHHIISDGISMSILMNDLSDAYKGIKLPALPIQYKDYAIWQNILLESEKIKEQEKFWLEMFKGDLPILNIPTDYDRPLVKSYKGDKVNIEVCSDLTNKIKTLMRDTGTTLHMILLVAYNLLLSKYCGQDDIIVGTITSGRKLSDVERVIGMFVNTIALRSYPEGEKTIGEFLREVKSCTLKAYENQDYHLEELLKNIRLHRAAGRNALFDTMLIVQNFEKTRMEAIDIKFERYYPREEITTFYDISLTGLEMDNTISLLFKFNVDLFRRDTILRFGQDLLKILRAITDDINCKLKNITLLEQKEIKEINEELSELDELLDGEFEF